MRLVAELKRRNVIRMAGLRHAVSWLANARGVPPEDFAARFPERD
ncbi:MAG: hypothetical protein ABI588_00375 [Arenimonas sp.]